MKAIGRRMARCFLGMGLALALGGCAPVGGGSGDGDDLEDLLEFNVVLGDGFVIRTRAGTTQGVDRVDICQAFFPAAPNHQLTITSGVSMQIQATSATDDVRLWVLCGQSNFCGEEVAPGVWEVSRFWGTAVCDVYVGTPTEGGEAEYALEFLPG